MAIYIGGLYMLKYFKVLADPTRFEIFELLLKGESCGCNLLDKLDISQPTLSYHLNTIFEAGLTTKVRDGNKVNYSVKVEVLEEIIDYFSNLKSIDYNCNVKLRKGEL